MKKIMFNNKYGLTQAVLDGHKTVTRRVIPQSILDSVDQFRVDYYNDTFDALTFKDGIEQMLIVERNPKLPFHIHEEVAVAQSYNEICYSPSVQESLENELGMSVEDSKGFNNKMFVKADLMPHRIKITNVRIERLQDISEEDCLKEGISTFKLSKALYYGWQVQEKINFFTNIRLAFAYLIDKISGKGTWNSNPYVLVYDFELIK